MKKISKVLAVIDPTTQDQPGLGRASWLAKKLEQNSNYSSATTMNT